MVENNEKCSKIIKKVLFSSYARETHVRLMQEHEEKCSFLSFMKITSNNFHWIKTARCLCFQSGKINVLFDEFHSMLLRDLEFFIGKLKFLFKMFI